jgi:hypothetical protein
MHKNVLLFAALLLLAGCGTKPIVIKAKQKPLQKPVEKIEKVQIPTEPTIQEPIETIEVETVEEEQLLNKSNSKSYVTTFKTQKFAFSDTGFMRNQDGIIDLQILALGKPLLKLKIADDVCVDHHCRTKEEFNMNYLNENYPPNLINNVLTSQPIFNGQNMKKTTNGFMQRIKDPRYDIKYKITPGSVYFKDLKNGIIIKLRELH